MQITTPLCSRPTQPATRSIERLQEASTFAQSVYDDFSVSDQRPSQQIDLMRSSSKLKKDVLKETASFDPRTATFLNAEAAMNIALAAATAGALDAIVYSQTQDTPFLVGALPISQSLSHDSFSQMGETQRTIDSMAGVMTEFCSGQTEDPEFAKNRISRSREELQEAFTDGSAGPGGYFQLGYRFGALTGIAASQSGGTP